MSRVLKLMKWSGITMLMLSVGCVTTSYSRAVLSKNNTTSVVNGHLEGTRSLPPRGKGYRSIVTGPDWSSYAHHKVIQTLETSLLLHTSPLADF